MYDPDLSRRLIKESVEDHERMTPGPWIMVSATIVGEIDVVAVNETSDSDGIARTRNNLAALADQLDAAGAEVERLTKERDLLDQAWRADQERRVVALNDRDRLAAEVENLSKNGPAWLRFALQCLHAQVDRTDPNDPVGAALTRAGLERLGADYGPEHAAHLARLSLTQEEVEALRRLSGWMHGDFAGNGFESYCEALAVVDKLLAAAEERNP